MVYRRFGYVFSRLFLRRQDEIRRMEDTLQAMDKTDDFEGHGKYLQSHALDDDRESIPKLWENQSRAQLMDSLEQKVLKYCKNDLDNPPMPLETLH